MTPPIPRLRRRRKALAATSVAKVSPVAAHGDLVPRFSMHSPGKGWAWPTRSLPPVRTRSSTSPATLVPNASTSSFFSLFSRLTMRPTQISFRPFPSPPFRHNKLSLPKHTLYWLAQHCPVAYRYSVSLHHTCTVYRVPVRRYSTIVLSQLFTRTGTRSCTVHPYSISLYSIIVLSQLYCTPAQYPPCIIPVQDTAVLLYASTVLRRTAYQYRIQLYCTPM